MRLVTDYFCSKWTALYGTDYPFRKLDGIKATDVLAACKGDVARAKQVVDRFFASTDKFYTGHALSMLASASALPKFMVGPLNGAYRPAKERRWAEQ